MKPEFEIILFELFDLKLQEPMALVTNWMTASFSLFAFFQIKNPIHDFTIWWKRFFLYLAIGTGVAGLGHLFFQYGGIYGKMPSWILAIVSGVCSSFAMMSLLEEGNYKNRMKVLVLLKSMLFLFWALWFANFLFIAIDAILTYLIVCGGGSLFFMKRTIPGMKFILLGVLVLLPSAFFFLMKINLHRYLNRDDVSHLLMLGCIMLFYKGVKQFSSSALKISGR